MPGVVSMPRGNVAQQCEQFTGSEPGSSSLDGASSFCSPSFLPAVVFSGFGGGVGFTFGRHSFSLFTRYFTSRSSRPIRSVMSFTVSRTGALRASFSCSATSVSRHSIVLRIAFSSVSISTAVNTSFSGLVSLVRLRALRRNPSEPLIICFSAFSAIGRSWCSQWRAYTSFATPRSSSSLVSYVSASASDPSSYSHSEISPHRLRIASISVSVAHDAYSCSSSFTCASITAFSAVSRRCFALSTWSSADSRLADASNSSPSSGTTYASSTFDGIGSLSVTIFGFTVAFFASVPSSAAFLSAGSPASGLASFAPPSASLSFPDCFLPSCCCCCCCSSSADSFPSFPLAGSSSSFASAPPSVGGFSSAGLSALSPENSLLIVLPIFWNVLSSSSSSSLVTVFSSTSSTLASEKMPESSSRKCALMPFDSTFSATLAFSRLATSLSCTRARSGEPSVSVSPFSTASSSAYCTVNSKSSVCLLNVITFFCGYEFIEPKSVRRTWRVAPLSPSRSNTTWIGNRTASFVMNFFTLKPVARSAARYTAPMQAASSAFRFFASSCPMWVRIIFNRHMGRR
uniref:Uncharacterized protein n=1 Tax=Anopheles coluzzii TaxID=1518534 RepID=A0A8W7P1L1_ANOCL